MKFTQGYLSPALSHFGFLQKFNLSPYKDINKPLVMFGCYADHNDYEIVNIHKGPLLIIWCGMDSRRIKEHHLHLLRKPNVLHSGDLPKINRVLRELNLNLITLKYFSDVKPAEPIILGNSIYAYLNHNNPNYYGGHIVGQLKTDYKILIGRGEFRKDEWDNGKADEYYRQCFCGLALSDFAAGATSITEMGLRGIPVITNVINLPHTIHWETIEDIQISINNCAENIGKRNDLLAQQVSDNVLTGTYDCFDLEFMKL